MDDIAEPTTEEIWNAFEKEFWTQPRYPDSIIDLRGVPHSLRYNEADRLMLLSDSVEPFTVLLMS